MPLSSLIPPERSIPLSGMISSKPSSSHLLVLAFNLGALSWSLIPISVRQKQVVDCSHFVVLTVKTALDQAHVDRFLERQIALRGGSLETLAAYRGVILSSLKGAAQAGRLDTWQTHQIYIALGQFMTTAALLGIDTCPMEGIDPTAYDQILGLADSGYKTVVACAAGFRSPNDIYASLPKVRFAREELIQHL